jgi:dihydrolipoamide dehydrogenase
MGLRTALVEKSELGGVCLNRGCIPTKSLLHAAELLYRMEEAEAIGITASRAEFDYTKILASKDNQVKTLADGIRFLLKKNGVTVYRGEADIASPDTVVVNGQKLLCKYIIIAVGSSPTKPNIAGMDNPEVITSDEALCLKQVPRSMAIIGGGIIGIEIAYAFQSFGCSVSIIEIEPYIAPLMDNDISIGLSALLKKRGVKIYTSTKVQCIQQGKILCNSGGRPLEIQAEKILVAVGRTSNGFNLSLDKLGIAHKNGFILTNAYLQTSIPNIFAVGDVNGKYMLAHVASSEGLRAVSNIAGNARTMDYSAVPG